MKRILLIDDEEAVLEMLESFLEETGAEIVKAREGNEGLRLMEQHPADVAIIDLYMPGKEGIETILELRQKNPLCNIIAISGVVMKDGFNALDLAKKMGASATLRKPFGRNELLDLVEPMLECCCHYN